MTPLASFSLSNPNVINFAYLVAASLFIVGLRDLNSPATARRGNFIAGIGMFIALVFTLLDQEIVSYTWIIVGSAIGTAIGVWSARSVKMTAMPQMVALFNGVGGGAVALIALSEYHVAMTNGIEIATDHEVAILFSLIIGSISFWGSNIAFMKLQELMSGSPKKAPGHRAINAALAGLTLATAGYLIGPGDSYIYPVSIAILAGILGIMLVLPIGGADMPVVISTLNAMTGLAAAAAGFALDNTVLIVAGAIVGASGSILTNLMAKAMNRSIGNVLFGSFGGAGDAVAGAPGATHDGTVRSTSAADAAILMAYAQDVIVVPGYGLAVAQAQHTVREMAEQLEKKGVRVKYAIHPVAGRMPGHMNVLLAEADVDYSQLVEMEDINPEFSRAQVALVVGANDVTNPAAKTPGSSIYGMPILEVADSDNIIVLKRGMNPGYAGIENELYFNPKTQMLFGDAKDSLAEVVTELKNL